ncbi:hypothetical protein ACFYUJ_22135 [Streptomyces sp. NPDC004520]|uniref:hypothetical protein n=1 Tax=Streptomyces sp. NPDC004520 TaxID=3364702 RepID=UPI0036BEB5BE
MRDTGSQRQRRQRLARQRPAPDSVRIRGRAGGPREGRSWWHRTDWARLATVVGVGAGIGTLLFTGVATYYGAMVSRDQLTQSREDADKKSRAQASRVSTWVDHGKDGGIRLHLMNRSPDPVSHVELYFTATTGDVDHTKLAVQYSVDLPSLPPCTDSVFDPDDWMYRVPRGGGPQGFPPSHSARLRPDDGWRKQPEPDGIQVPYLTFADREGVTWQRASGDLEPWRPAGELSVPEADRYGIGGTARDPEAEPVAACEEPAGG